MSNAVPDDPDWCGHPMVDVQTWQCHACGRPVTPATRRRIEQAPTVAPAGYVWVLTEGPGWSYEEDYAGGAVLGVFTDRAKIVPRLVRDYVIGAASLRKWLGRITWYRSVYNPNAIEGWGTDDKGNEVNYHLGLHEIDHVG